MSFFRPWECSRVNNCDVTAPHTSQFLLDVDLRRQHDLFMKRLNKLIKIEADFTRQLYNYYTVQLRLLHNSAVSCAHLQAERTYNILTHQQQYVNLLYVVNKQCELLENRNSNKGLDVTQEHQHILQDQSRTSPDQMRNIEIDSDYYSEDSSPVLIRTNRTLSYESHTRLLNKDALNILNCWYKEHLSHPYPTTSETFHLASICHVKTSQVKKWMSNKRMRNQNTKQHRRTDRQKLIQHRMVY